MEIQDEFYYRFKPEYRLRIVYKDDYKKFSEEFYCYAQINSSMSYSLLEVSIDNSNLYSYPLVTLDGGRLTIPIPKWGFIYKDKFHQKHYSYKYYILNSNEEAILNFLVDQENQAQLFALQNHMTVVLLFQSEEEKTDFEKYAEQNIMEIARDIKEESYYCDIHTDDANKRDVFIDNLHVGLVLNSHLDTFRKSKKQ